MQTACGKKEISSETVPARIVSLAPSITETLFALGLGDRVIGVTKHCSYPPEVSAVEKIGGYADANLERIVSLRPDLVVLSDMHEKQRVYLERFGIRTLTVNHTGWSSICTSFVLIGKACGASSASDSLVSAFNNGLQKNQRNTEEKARVLFCVGRDAPGTGSISSIFAAGRSTFYNDIIEAAGGENAFRDSFPAYSKLSAEGIFSLAPDLIIDVAPAMGRYSCSLLVRDWQTLTRVPAVKHKQVHCMSGEYVTIPGPRLLMLLDDLQQILQSYYQKRSHE